MTFDEEKNLLYVPGGNAAPDIYDQGRPGTNLYTNSLIALDAMTGRLVWYRQTRRANFLQEGPEPRLSRFRPLSRKGDTANGQAA